MFVQVGHKMDGLTGCHWKPNMLPQFAAPFCISVVYIGALKVLNGTRYIGYERLISSGF
jgi:hypothetical protein